MAKRKTATPDTNAPRKRSGSTVKAATARTKPAPRKRAPRKPAAAVAPAPERPVSDAEARYRAIADAAYLRAEQRGFAPGGEIDDWLAAEAEFDARQQAG